MFIKENNNFKKCFILLVIFGLIAIDCRAQKQDGLSIQKQSIEQEINNLQQIKQELRVYIDQELARQRQEQKQALDKSVWDILKEYTRHIKDIVRQSVKEFMISPSTVEAQPIIPLGQRPLTNIPPALHNVLQQIGVNDVEQLVKKRPESEVMNLSQAVSLALEYNQQFKTAQAEIDAAAAKRKEAARALWPHFFVEASQTSGNILEDVEFEEKKYGIRMEHTLYSSGHLRSAYKQSLTQYEAAQKRLERVTFDVYLKVATVYYELVKAMFNYRLQQDLLNDVEKDFKLTQEKYEQGIITQEEYMEVQTRYNQVAFQNLSAQRDIALAQYKFMQTLEAQDQMPTIASKSIDATMQFGDVDVSLDSIMDKALRHRLELTIAQLMVKVNEYEKKIARSKDDFRIELNTFAGQSASYYKTESAEYKPEWSAMLKITKSFGPNTIDYSFTKDDTSPKLGQSERTGTTQNAVKIGLWDNFSRQSRIKKAEAEYQKSLQDLTQAKREVGVNAHQAFFGYEEAVLRIRNSCDRIKLARQRLSSSSYQHNLNQIPLSQVLDAKIKLVDEQSLYYQALADYKLSLCKLDKAIGEVGKYSEITVGTALIKN